MKILQFFLVLLALNVGPMLQLQAQTSDKPLSDAAAPLVMSPEEGDVLWFSHESPDELGSGGELRIFIDHTLLPEAKSSFAKFTLGVGGSLPIHRHNKTEEIAYIISGEGSVIGLDDDGNETAVPISSGYAWYNPPGAWHAVRNTGEIPLELVFATVPNEEMGLLSFFRQIGVEPGQEAKVLTPEEVGGLADSHDMIFKDE